MIDRLEKLEDEFNLIKYQFEFTQKFIESDEKKTVALDETIKNMTNSLKIINDKITDLQKSCAIASKNRAHNFELLQSQGRTLKTIMETLEVMSKQK